MTQDAWLDATVTHIQRTLVAGQVPILVGPTGIGKSALAIALARLLDGEIISMDSCAIYRGMNIGTAKPSWQERHEINHHLLDILEPSERYSVGCFFANAKRLVADIVSRGKLPIVAGGTMMYANALLQGLVRIPAIGKSSRQRARELIEGQGLLATHRELATIDPVVAARIHAHDRQRLQRAWEVYFETGQSLGQWQQQGNQLPDFQVAMYAMVPRDRQQLIESLATRIFHMVEDGFVQEVELLLARYGPSLATLKSVGYKQFVQHVLGQTTLSDAIIATKHATQQLARYQLSWIRRLDLPQIIVG